MKSGISKGSFILYLSIFVLISTFMIYVFFCDKANDARHDQSTYDVMEWNDFQKEENMTQTVLSGVIKVDAKIGNVLAFYSIHQSVKVFVDNQLIYRYPVINDNPISSSPGYNWNFVTLPNRVNNIEIEISSPYESYLKSVPDFFIGNNISVPAYILSANIVPFIICIIMLMLGILMVIYHYVVSRNVKTDGKLLKLGIFSILLSLWSINECRATVLIIHNNLVTSYFSLLALMMLPIPFCVFVKTFYEDDSNIWSIFCKIDLFQIICCIVMQLIGMYDLKETLWTTHAMIGLLLIIICVQSFKLIKNETHSRMVKLHIICIVVCSSALMTDIAAYYFTSWRGNTLGRIGFLIYIIVLCVASFGESASLMKKGLEANAYQTLAYTDQMTGLNNRTCFNIDFEQLSKAPTDVAIIDFDLNNLKYANDTYGHSIGDQYIKDCSTIISEIFNGIGKCYRVGGDEFVAIIEKSSSLDLHYYLAMLESSVDALNRENKKQGQKVPKMQIAYGCAVYSPDLDKNLEETYNRADKLMYIDKKAKKEIRNKI